MSVTIQTLHRNIIKKLNGKALLDYQLKNADLLFKYAACKKRPIMNTLDALRKKSVNLIATYDRDKYYHRYRANIDPEYMFYPDSEINDDTFCSDCKVFKVLDPVSAKVTCVSCGKCDTTLIMEPEEEQISMNLQCVYKRTEHFSDLISYLQAKEQDNIPDSLVEYVLREMKKAGISKEELTENDLLRYIKKEYKRSRYKLHVAKLLFKINGVLPPQMTNEMEEALKQRFNEIQEPFELYKGDRKNMTQYGHLIYKLCQLLGQSDPAYLQFLPKLHFTKNKKLLNELDALWKKICQHLGWQYFKT